MVQVSYILIEGSNREDKQRNTNCDCPQAVNSVEMR